LLESAWRLFQEQGYDQATVEDITEAADVAKSTFFNYFETKEAILDEIALWRIDLLGSEVLEAEDVPESAVARIKLTMKAMIDEIGPGQDLPRHLLMARISGPTKRESAHRLGGLLHGLVAQGQAQHEIRDDVDAGLIARLLLTSVFHHMHRQRNAYHGESAHGAQEGELERDTSPAETGPLDAKLGETVDALMGGLGGPQWRVP
jgi:AcrR family transcriptional regulator